MRSRVFSSVTSLVFVAVLLLVSCGPRAAPSPVTTPPPATVTPAPPPTTAPLPTPTPTLAEKPKYGGVINIMRRTDLATFDAATVSGGQELGHIVYEEFIWQDWAKGKGGTGEVDWAGYFGSMEAMTGELAESWNIPEIGVWKFQIRKGIHWALNPASEASRLMNSREYAADDAVWSTSRYKSLPNSQINISQGLMAKAATIEKTGPWEVTLKTPVDPWTGFCWLAWGGGYNYHWPREVVEKYGNVQNWRNAVGTGPFMLTDFVSGSVATLTKNPNWWRRNPVGPGKGDQLPYVDMVKLLIVSDTSTQLAALRTGKADWLDGVEWGDAKQLIQSSASFQYKRYLPAGLSIGMRMDKAELPFKDLRVRQALMMATDFEAMRKDLYEGQAEILDMPAAPISGAENIYLPMEQLPESVQALFKYNPQRAKQLLAEAGYPNGFKTKMIVQNTSDQMDPASVFKAMWAKVGIDVELQPRESAVFTSIYFSRAAEEMVLGSGRSMSFGTYLFFSPYRGESRSNISFVNDPLIEKTYQEIQKNVVINMSKANELVRGIIPRIIEQAYYIPRPTPYSYFFWQPWVKNYYGQGSYTFFLPYIWVDQDLKEKVTGRR